MGVDTTPLDAKWTKNIEYVKDTDGSKTKTLSYFYPDDKWGGYCSATDATKTVCDAAMTYAKYGQFSRGVYTTDATNVKL